MIHKEETLVCPSVKYADQISQCKQMHCKDCKEKEKQYSDKIETLEKKLKVMTIVGAIAATVVGKDLLDKVMASFDKFQDVQKKIDDAAGGVSVPSPASATPNPTDASKGTPLSPVQTTMSNPYAQSIDGEHSAYVTSLSTPYPMDPSMASASRSKYFDWNPSIVLGSPATTILSYEMNIQEISETSRNTMLVYEFPTDVYTYDDGLGKNKLSNFTENFTNTQNDGIGWSNFAFNTVPAPATISLLIPCLCMVGRSRK